MLEFRDISFQYPERSSPAVGPLSMTIAQGEHLAIVGESGCAKTTLLKLIYGIYDLDQGEILWKGQRLLGPKDQILPGAPFMKYLAQDFDLMPSISAAENLGKFLSRMDMEARQQRIEELLEVVQMSAFAKAKTSTLSGGQKQRIALARVLAKEPQLLLLDEPFSHIDHFQKSSLRRSLFAYLKKQNITVLTASHDREDVLPFADRVLVLKSGRKVALKPTQELYANPGTAYQASLLGEINEIPENWLDPKASSKAILVRPHELRIVRKAGFEVEVLATYFQGTHYLVKAQKEQRIVLFESKKAVSEGKVVKIGR
ncbi:ABC transporter ATP-binding protein [Croceiramulus getboli]|nr:ABC transporter ATP-binding protein [Flavobacteriaceae bacterium YJPT1-3]